MQKSDQQDLIVGNQHGGNKKRDDDPVPGEYKDQDPRQDEEDGDEGA